MGSSNLDIAEVRTLGYSGWIDAQFATPRGTSMWDWLVARGYNVTANRDNQTGFDNAMWRQLIGESGQLRVRTALALLEILVVGIDGVNLSWRQFSMAAYVDILMDEAFGNYRTILQRITTNAAMGSFLTFLGNRKANPANGSVPDENYAREILQLFTLGLLRLNMDGTVVFAGGVPVETYTQEDIAGLARVFTGLSLDSNDNATPDRYRRPLIVNASLNETGGASFLGATIPSGTGGMTAIGLALDAIFNHPNVPPFVSKQLIQRLVTSNPSPGYIARVAAVFANNGSGVRGDMRAILRAILLDPEARNDPDPNARTGGKLREPVMRLTAWARAFKATSSGDTWPIGNTSSQDNRLAQTMGRSPSVFNFFRPGFTPPNTAISGEGLVAPEFQITNELSVVAYINYMRTLVESGTGDFTANYADMLTIQADAQLLCDEVNVLLAAGQLSPATVTTIRNAVASISATTTNGPLNRVRTAILLTLAAPEFITLR